MQAQYAVDLPEAVFEAPEDHEFAGLALAGFGFVGEGVVADFDGSVVGDGVDFDAARGEVAGYFAADVFLDGFDEFSF